MKTIKTRYDYIFLIYLPIALAGLLAGIFIPLFFVNAISLISIILAGLIIIYALTPDSKRILCGESPPRYSVYRWLGQIFSWQIALYVIFFSIMQATLLEVPIGHTLNDITSLNISITRTLEVTQYGFLAWVFYIATGIALGLFSASVAFPATLRNAVYPIMKKTSEGIIGYGIELFIRQSLAIVMAFSLAVNLLQFYQIISLHLHLISLTPLTLHVLLLASCLFLLLSMPATQRLTQILWNKTTSPRLLISLYCLAAIVILLLFNLIIKFVAAYLFTFPSTAINSVFLFRSSDHWMTQWLLLSSGWWLAWTPLLAMKLIKLAAGRSVRSFVLANLCLPASLSCATGLTQHFSPDLLASLLLRFSQHAMLAATSAIVSVILLLYYFHDPEKEAIVVATSTRPLIQKKQSYIYLQIVLQLSTLFLVCYLFNGLHFISLLMTAIVLPVIISCLLAIIALLRKQKNP